MILRRETATSEYVDRNVIGLILRLWLNEVNPRCIVALSCNTIIVLSTQRQRYLHVQKLLAINCLAIHISAELCLLKFLFVINIYFIFQRIQLEKKFT